MSSVDFYIIYLFRLPFNFRIDDISVCITTKVPKMNYLKITKLIVRYPKTIPFEMYALTGIITVENITMYKVNVYAKCLFLVIKKSPNRKIVNIL